MENLEQIAIITAPLKLWKRYVDDIYEILNKSKVNQLTDHLNQVDKSGNIKFTSETEEDGKLPFLDALKVRREDGSIKLLVFRKPTHTEQYLNFNSHHPLHQKLGVRRSLLDRCKSVVTEHTDRLTEEKHVCEALIQVWIPQVGI
jgi:hypothetical protein